MELRATIEDIIREALPGIVRDLLAKGLESDPGQKQGRAKSRLRRTEPKAPRPPRALEHGIKVGQKWRGKEYTGAKGRLIEIATLGKDKVTPKVLKTAKGKRPTAKQISYAQLTNTYTLVSPK